MDPIKNPEAEKNLIKEIFHNELVWLATIILAVWGFVTTVVLPLQRVEIGLAQMESDTIELKKNYSQALAEHQSLTHRMDVVETEIKPFIKQ